MSKFVDKLRRDSLPMGLFLGIVCPAALFGILYLVAFLVQQNTGNLNIDKMFQKMILLSIVPNVLLLRHYLVKLKYDLTGRGIVIVTFCLALVFAIMEVAA